MKSTIYDDHYFDLRALAAYSSLSVRTLRDYLGDVVDPIPSYRIKKKILVRKAEFDEWMMKRRAHPRRISRMADELYEALTTR